MQNLHRCCAIFLKSKNLRKINKNSKKLYDMVQLFDIRPYLMALKRPMKSSLLHVMGVLLLEFVLGRPVDTSASVMVTQPNDESNNRTNLKALGKPQKRPPPFLSLVATFFVIFFSIYKFFFFFNSGQ